MNIFNNNKYKKAAVICCFLLLTAQVTISQTFSYSCLKEFKTNISYVNDDIYPIFNLVKNAGIYVKSMDEFSKLNFFYLRKDSLIFKELPIENKYGLAYFFSSFDTTTVASLSDLRNNPIIIYKQNKKGLFEKNKIIDLTKQKKINKADDLFLINENTLFISASYNYSDYKKLSIAKINLTTSKVEKTVSFSINENELRFSHFPKQWITMNKKNIAIIHPFSKKIILLDTLLNINKEVNIEKLNLSKSENEFNHNIDTSLIKEFNHYPKNIIDYFIKKNIIDIRRIEKISFINDNELLLSLISFPFNYKRSLYLVNINSEQITDSISIDYRESNNNDKIDTRFSNSLFFDGKGISLNINDKDSINENEINYKIKQFKLCKSISDSSLTISSKFLMNSDIKNVKNNKSSIDYICNYNKVLFMNMLFCFSDYCLRDIERNELLVYITNTDNYISNLSTKNMLEKKYKFENILFINETKFKEQFPNIIPNKEYYILTK